VVSGTEQKNSTSLFLPWILATKVLIALTPEMDCDQTAMGLLPVTSAVFLIAVIMQVVCMYVYVCRQKIIVPVNVIKRTLGLYTYINYSLVWCPGQNKRIAPLSFLHGCCKRRLKD
jgi:hypothetical protein